MLLVRDVVLGFVEDDVAVGALADVGHLGGLDEDGGGEHRPWGEQALAGRGEGARGGLEDAWG